LKKVLLIGREHAQAGVPDETACSSVAEATPGTAAIPGSGAAAITNAS
jgi:hypothetical protein